jgi:hypothetical protein
MMLVTAVKQVSLVTDTLAAEREMLEAVFSMRSVPTAMGKS